MSTYSYRGRHRAEDRRAWVTDRWFRGLLGTAVLALIVGVALITGGDPAHAAVYQFIEGGQLS